MSIGYTGAPRILPWSGVRLLSAATLPERALGPAASGIGRKKKKRMGFAQRMMLDGVFPGLGTIMAASANRHAKKAERLGSRPRSGPARDIEVADGFAADADGTLLHLRFRGPDLYYGDILGDARAGDPAADFRAVLGTLMAHATAARVTPALHALVAPGTDAAPDAAEAAFENEHAFGEYNRWQLQMLALTEA